MSIINFSVPVKLDQQIKKIVKEKGFASKAEFFRFAAMYTMGNIAPAEPLDEIIREARADYEAGKYKSARSAKALLRGLNQ